MENNEQPELNGKGNRRGMPLKSRMNLGSGNPNWKRGGPSPNPNGRPRKDVSLTTIMKEMIDKPADYIGVGSTPTDKTWRQVLVKALFTKGARGDIKAIELILERIDGKVIQPVNIPGKVVIEWIYRDRGKNGSSD